MPSSRHRLERLGARDERHDCRRLGVRRRSLRRDAARAGWLCHLRAWPLSLRAPTGLKGWAPMTAVDERALVPRPGARRRNRWLALAAVGAALVAILAFLLAGVGQ